MSGGGPELRERVARILGRPVTRAVPLAGGQIGQVTRLELAGGGAVVAKRSPGTPLETEAAMLEHLRAHSRLPVPEVLHAEDDLLLLAHLPGGSRHDAGAAGHLAELIAELHARPAPAFGFPYDTLLGPFVQENATGEDWPAFFAERRLRPMLLRARASGHLPEPLGVRCDRAIARTATVLDHRPEPALVHGDLWAANVLSDNGRVTAVLDPAIYWADPEVELAYLDLFASFGEAFFRRYRQLRPIDDGFWRRRWLYQLYPLLVHVTLFGAGYLPPLAERLDRLAT